MEIRFSSTNFINKWNQNSEPFSSYSEANLSKCNNLGIVLRVKAPKLFKLLWEIVQGGHAIPDGSKTIVDAPLTKLKIWSKGFLKISKFVKRNLTEHIGVKNSLDSKLQIESICSIRIFFLKFMISFPNRFSAFSIPILKLQAWKISPKVTIKIKIGLKKG